SQSLAVRAVDDELNHVRVPAEGEKLCLAGRVPDLRRLVPAGRSETFAVWAVRDPDHRSGMCVKLGQLTAGHDVVNLHKAAVAGPGDVLSVGAVCGGAEIVTKGGIFFPRRHVPDLDHAAHRRGGKQMTVAAET